MKPTEELMHEHAVILHMLSGAERLAQSILSTHIVEIAKVTDVIDFSRHFTDGCHHSKEEKHLFVRLVEKGMSKEQGPIAVMLNEHRMGRELIRQIETSLQEYRSGKKEASDSVSQSMLRYVELLRAHIAKENNILFPMGDRILTPDDQQSLEKAFKNVEEQEIGEGVHEKYHRLAHEISGSLKP
jgi:hemerythrin-like domain-containing protein